MVRMEPDRGELKVQVSAVRAGGLGRWSTRISVNLPDSD